MDLITEPFTLGFQQRALLGGLVAALMSAVVGVWLVLRGMSFFGDAFVHGILPGIAAAVMLDFSPYLGAVIAAAVMLFGVEVVHRQTALSEDTGIPATREASPASCSGMHWASASQTCVLRRCWRFR